MQFLDYTHNPWLVLFSLLVALMAGLTGLSLTKGLSTHSDMQKKVRIALAAVALGGGIWSMHFVAMLGLRLPILFYYDAAVTLASAVIAILIVGLALLILHFMERTRATLSVSGVMVGLGIIAMHYTGMAGLELCQAHYTPIGIGLAVICSCLLNVVAFSVAYGNRTHRNTVFGTMFFGIAVFCVHFIAMWGTSFTAVETPDEVGPLIGNEGMAIGVVLTSFILCGAFLLAGVTFLKPLPVATDSEPTDKLVDTASVAKIRVPYEHEKRTQFIGTDRIAVIQADGPYTSLYTAKDKLFCNWSLTEAEKRLNSTGFIKTHRSYLVNPAFVCGFERNKDNGLCRFDIANLDRVPISRSRLKAVRDVLGV